LAGSLAPDDGADVRSELEDGVLTIRLSRPEARNAISATMLDGLAAALDRAESPEVAVVVLTGGDTFCAGGDVRRMSDKDSIFGPHDQPELRTARQQQAQRRTVVRLRELGKPTIAAISGPAVGAGLGLALGCHLRYASESAILLTGFSRVGLAGDFGCAWLLRDLVGPAVAIELLLRSTPVRATDALRLGLVNAVLPYLEDGVQGLARELASLSRPAVQAVLANVAAAATSTLAAACDRDAETHVRLTLTAEHRAAVRRLVESMGPAR
jgi:2-(1,2-epoxy-1,2-dihydrophenyl)acetyl-CoA isomerase